MTQDNARNGLNDYKAYPEGAFNNRLLEVLHKHVPGQEPAFYQQ